MLRVENPQHRMAGALHDVVEDTAATIQHLEQEGFSPEVLRAIIALSKLLGETRL